MDLTIETPPLAQTEIGESRNARFERFNNQGINHFLTLLDQRFGEGRENEQIFHRRYHTEDALARADKLITTVQKADKTLLDDHDAQLVRLAIAGHDLVQDRLMDIANKGTTIESRFRNRGPNEINSSKEVLDYMRSVNQREGEIIYSVRDMELVEEAIALTLPTFDPARKAVFQNGIIPESSVVATIVALADLGGAGIDGSKQFEKEGNREFQELKIGKTRQIKAAQAAGTLGLLPEVDMEQISSEIVKWLQDQPAFAQGREYYLDHDLAPFHNPKVSEALKGEVFTQFGSSIAHAQSRAEQAAKLVAPNITDQNQKRENFKKLLEMVGYIEPSQFQDQQMPKAT